MSVCYTRLQSNIAKIDKSKFEHELNVIEGKILDKKCIAGSKQEVLENLRKIDPKLVGGDRFISGAVPIGFGLVAELFFFLKYEWRDYFQKDEINALKKECRQFYTEENKLTKEIEEISYKILLKSKISVPLKKSSRKPLPHSILRAVKTHPQGFQNLNGNTCWFNAMTSGFTMAPFAEVLLTKDLVQRQGESDGSFAVRKDLQANLRALREEYVKPNENSTENSKIKRALLSTTLRSPLFTNAGLSPGRRQEDAQEYYMILAAALQIEDHPEMGVLVQTKLNFDEGASRTRPGGGSSLLTLPMPKNARVLSAQSLVSNFFQMERIHLREGGNGYQNAFLRLTNREGVSPTVLSLHFIRFWVDHSRTQGRDRGGNLIPLSGKNQARIEGLDGPIQIPFIDAKGTTKVSEYQVSRVICHIGMGKKTGHYVSVVKNAQGNWELHNDSQVRELTPEEASLKIAREAYQVFIEKTKEEVEAGSVLISVPSLGISQDTTKTVQELQETAKEAAVQRKQAEDTEAIKAAIMRLEREQRASTPTKETGVTQQSLSERKQVPLGRIEGDNSASSQSPSFYTRPYVKRQKQIKSNEFGLEAFFGRFFNRNAVSAFPKKNQEGPLAVSSDVQKVEVKASDSTSLSLVDRIVGFFASYF